MLAALLEPLRGAATALDAGRASEGQMILVVAVLLVTLTVALIVASPLTNRSRRSAVEVTGPPASSVAAAPGILRLAGLVAVLLVVTGVRRSSAADGDTAARRRGGHGGTSGGSALRGGITFRVGVGSRCGLVQCWVVAGRQRY